MKLQIAEHLALPADVVTEKLAFLGRTGTGKTYAAMKLAELMLEAGAQVLALDAVGKWYGLRVDGPGAGFPIPVFGGLNGDFPLEATGGKLMADVVTERGISAVLDVSQFTHGEQIRFALEFATQFFQRKKSAPSAVHLFLEECQEFVPQNAMPGEQAMLSAFERLWKLGRNFGIGGSLISQRPQEINKKALNQTGTLFVFQMTGPQERKAIEQWVSAQGINEDIGEVLPTLRQGEPHVWSPTFLSVSKTVRISEKRTADVSATPKFGARAKERPLTPIDAEELRGQMAATIERAKAEDPKELRRQLAQVREELRRLQSQAQPAPPQPERIEVPVITADDLTRLMTLFDQADLVRRKFNDEFVERLQAAYEPIKQQAAEILHRLQALKSAPGGTRAYYAREKPTARNAQQSIASPRGGDRTERLNARRPASQVRANVAAGDMGRGERIVLAAVAQYPDGAARDQLTVLTGYKRSSRDTYLQRLLSRGFVTSNGDGTISPTDDGIAALGDDYEPLPTGRDLRDYWRQHLTGGERAILSEVIRHYPNAAEREALSEATGYKRSSRDTYIQRLVSRRLVTIEGRGAVRASNTLFD